MRAAAARAGIALPDGIDLVAAALAAGLILLVGAAAWLVAARLGPRLAEAWARRAKSHGEAMAPRLCAILRYGLIWPALSIILAVDDWPPLASLLLGLAAATAAALLIRNVGRGLALPRWVAWLLAVFLFVGILADAVGGLGPIQATLDRLAFQIGRRRLSLLSLVQITIALLVLYAVIKLAMHLTRQLIGRSHLDPTQQLLGQKLAAIAIIAAGFFIAIDLAGIDLTALAVFSGAVGLAIGFGLQKTFGNLIAGIILLMDRSIKPGDVISVGDTFGSISRIGVRAVSIVTREGKEYLIPNEILMTEQVVNWSYSTRDVRISIPVGIAYDCDVALAQKLMVEAASASPRVLATPRPVVWMTGFGESSIEHEIRIWIADPEAGLGSVRSDILTRLWQLFRENGMVIPFPQRDLWLRNWPEAAPRGTEPSRG